MIIRKLFEVGLASLVMMITSGCSITSIGSVQTQIDTTDECDNAEISLKEKGTNDNLQSPIFVSEKGKLSTDYLNALIKAETTIDPLLDCVLVDVESTEARIYRGHVVISLLAAYGAYNFNIESYEERVGDAVTFLVHLQKAEKALRAASTTLNESVEDEELIQNQKRLERVLSVLEVALYAERPTLRRMKSRVRSLVGAIATDKNLVRSAAEAAVGGLKKAIHLRHFGRAYLKDAIVDLERFSIKGVKQPQYKDWERRDSMIKVACTKIATIAELDGFKCIPPKL
ncbi:MAG: hypothetical protein AB2535_16735 [Candidatus Thiodiazotropha endolucinida]